MTTVNFFRATFRKTRTLALGCSLLLAGTLIAFSQEAPVPGDLAEPRNAPDLPDLTDGSEVLTRGPIHEAFAELTSPDPEPGIVVPKTPPDPIEELPPDAKPEGENVVWIPGYWAWDDDRDDFIWLSGLWRQPPPNSMWVPGYWTEADDGYQWIAGYWSHLQPDEQNVTPAALETVYLPEPPDSLENGPSSPQPSDNHLWISGCWRWQGARFFWRPGYWMVAQPDWMWVPDRYLWTPAGCVFIPGYWDYLLAYRGCLFAPVYFSPVVYRRPAFVYSPTIVLNQTALVGCLFGRPAYQHYYFGDYYATNYSQMGIFPWMQLSRRGYDPLFNYSRWYYSRNDRGWANRMQNNFERRRNDVNLRPPRTLVAMRQAHRDNGPGQRGDRDALLATSLASLTKSPRDNSLRFERLDAGRRQKFVQQSQELRDFRKARVTQEQHGRSPQQLRQPVEQELRIPKGLSQRFEARPARENAPPARPGREVPRFDQKDGRPPAAERRQPRRPDARPEVRQPGQGPAKPGADRPEPPRGKRGEGRDDTPGVQPRPQPKPQPRPGVKPEQPRPQVPRGERPRGEGKKPETPPAGVQPKPQPPKVAPQPRPMPQPKPPAVSPRPKPPGGIAPQPQPRPQPRPMPKPQPRPERPKAGPQPRPQPQPPKVAPRPQPQNPPAVAPGDRSPKEKDNPRPGRGPKSPKEPK